MMVVQRCNLAVMHSYGVVRVYMYLQIYTRVICMGHNFLNISVCDIAVVYQRFVLTGDVSTMPHFFDGNPYF